MSSLETTGQALDIQGGEGDDSVYVSEGTDVKANNLTATEGNDAIYLLGEIGNMLNQTWILYIPLREISMGSRPSVL